MLAVLVVLKLGRSHQSGNATFWDAAEGRRALETCEKGIRLVAEDLSDGKEGMEEGRKEGAVGRWFKGKV